MEGCSVMTKVVGAQVSSDNGNNAVGVVGDDVLLVTKWL